MKEFFYTLIFLIFLYLGYLFVPNQVFNAGYWWLAIPFIFLFALVTTCSIQKIRINYKSKSSKRGFIASIIGFGALQVCGLSAYACTTALGFTIMAVILPPTILNFFQQYSVLIISIAIVIQIYALIQLNCFKFFKIR
jgi:hypothetical protein